MPQYDLPLTELRAYAPDLPAPADLDRFWSTTLAEARGHDLAATFAPVDSGLAVIETLDVTFAGFGGDPIRGWLHLPAGRDRPLAAVVEYVGYGGGRGLAHERVLWAAAGYAHFVMDTRGQGSSWGVGATPDRGATGDPAHPGFMTQGILDPATLLLSAAHHRCGAGGRRGSEPSRGRPRTGRGHRRQPGRRAGDCDRGLVDDVVAAMPDVPFLCDFPRALTLSEADPYAEIGRYLRAHRNHVDQVLATLAYFDMAILGGRPRRRRCSRSG